MLEQRLENLEKRVAELTTAIGELITVLTDNNPPPETPVQAVANIDEARNNNQETEQPVQAQEIDVEAVRTALINLAKEKGREAAKTVLAEFNANKVGDLKPSQYQKLIDSANQYQEAA